MQSANEWCDISTWCMCIVRLMWYRSNFKMLGTYTIRCLFENLTPSLHTFITFFYTLKIEILNAFISDAQWKWLIYNTELPLQQQHRFSTCNSFLCWLLCIARLCIQRRILYTSYIIHMGQWAICACMARDILEVVWKYVGKKTHWNEVKYFSYVLSNRFLFQVSTRR